MMTVASSRVVSNIFFSCLKGPIRKHVLRERTVLRGAPGRSSRSRLTISKSGSTFLNTEGTRVS